MSRLDLRSLVAAVTDPKAVPGAVFHATDAAIAFPTTPAERRNWHESRRVVLVQAAKYNTVGGAPPTVLVVPCSTSHQGTVGTYDIEIPEGTSGFSKASVAYVSLVQPICKADLGEHAGNLPASLLQEVQRRLYGLLSLSHGL